MGNPLRSDNTESVEFLIRADVVFGEEGDSTLLGAITLEAMGLTLNPIKRELSPIPMPFRIPLFA